jgi:hypothetical protein
MSTTVANPDDLSLKSYLTYSIVFHALLAVAVLSASYLERRGNSWGGVGGSLGGTKVSLVSAGIPMPKEAVVPESKAVDPTKGLPNRPSRKRTQPRSPNSIKKGASLLRPSQERSTAKPRLQITPSPTARVAIPIFRLVIPKLPVAPRAWPSKARAEAILEVAIPGM